MKTPVVVRAIGFGVLTTVLCGFAWQTLAADKPLLLWTPNQLVLTKSMPPEIGRYPSGIDYLNAPDFSAMPRTGLIPTHWEPNKQLIPTEIEARTLTVQRSFFSPNPPMPYEAQNFYLNKQSRGVVRRTSTPTITQLLKEPALKLTRPASK